MDSKPEFVHPDRPHDAFHGTMTMFRLVPGVDGICVGSDGGAWSCRVPGGGRSRHWHELAQAVNAYGYRVICLGPSQTVFVHRLILQAFVGECPPGMECRHLNGSRADNRLSNLAWGTPAENTEDKYKHGTNLLQSLKGERNGRAKLTAADIRQIRRLASGGQAVTSIASTFGIGLTTVRNIMKRRRWAHVAD